MNSESDRWVLAFDASCGTCAQLASTVASECGERLSVQPLSQPQVKQWREQALGEQAPWAPTLIKVGGAQVRAWTGAGMTLPLARRLGPASATRLLRTLGELHRRRDEPTISPVAVGRRGFLNLGAGAAVAAALVVFGKTPAFADPARSSAAARAWVAAHPETLPRDYDQFATYTTAHRRAIYAALPARDRSRLWAEHLHRACAKQPTLSTEQRAVLRSAAALAADEGVFAPSPPSAPLPVHHKQLDALRQAAIAAFGLTEARLLLATLGPAPTANAAITPADITPQICGECECSVDSNYCGSTCCRADCHGPRPCECVNDDCGTFYAYSCNGWCGSPGCGFIACAS